VFEKVQKIVPINFLYDVDTVYVGKFEDLIKRDVNAVYSDGAIYLSNEQDSELDMIDDIVHEIGHAVEQQFSYQLFWDGKIEQEFLKKRERLMQILGAYDVPLLDRRMFLDVEYSVDFDEYLYDTVGYDRLTYWTMNLFISPYGATSISEYFANVFGDTLLHPETTDAKAICPETYQKILELIDGEK